MLSETGTRFSAVRAASGCPKTDFLALSRWAKRSLAGLVTWACFTVCLANADEKSAAGSAPADLTELSLQELMAVKIERVSTPSRFTQAASEAPASVSVVTSEEIEVFGYRTLGDILRSVRGMYVTYDRSYTYLGVRGFSRPSDYNSRMLLLVDGHRMNDTLFGSGFIGNEFILDVDLIDRVEVVRGPTSSLYGNSAFFGVINVMTKRAADLKNVEVSGAVGGEGSYKGRFTAAGVLTNTGVQFVLSGSFYNSQGNRDLYFPEFDDPASNNGIAHDLDGEQAWNLFGSLSWNDLTLSAAYVSREKYIPTASWDTLFNDPRYRTVDEHGYVDLKWQHSLDEDNDLLARAYFDDYRYNANYPNLPTDPPSASLSRDDDLGQTVGGELQWTTRWREHVLTFGTELQDHLCQNQSFYDVDPPYTYLDDRRSSFDVGLYGQGDFMILTNLRLNAGVRYDYYNEFGDTVNPRAGLIYQPWNRTVFKLLYGTAFRAPNVFEMYYEVLPSNIGNPNLQPEKIQTYELVYEQGLPANLKLTLSGEYYHIDDLINQVNVTPDSLMFRNTGQANAKGVEAELEWRAPCGVLARVSYSLQRAEDAETGNSLINSPQSLVKCNLLVPLWRDKIFTGVELQYNSRVKTLAGANADEFCVVNWTLFSQNLFKGVKLSASLYNVFDAHYAFPGGPGHTEDVLWQDGRSFRVKLDYRF